MGVMGRRASRASRRKFILVFMPCMYLIPCLFGNFTAIYGPGTGELAGDGGVFDGRDGATSEARFATLPPVFDGDVNESVEGWRDGDGQRKWTASAISHKPRVLWQLWELQQTMANYGQLWSNPGFADAYITPCMSGALRVCLNGFPDIVVACAPQAVGVYSTAVPSTLGRW
ncbi:hypothetical protein B0H11DRAFT_2402641 [Mycena galericulata]|nr:hypothetical protein B0H11DRAFT_2402641 [Mycena galericulata]